MNGIARYLSFTTHHVPEIGAVLRVLDVNAAVPGDMLPARVRLRAAWRDHGGNKVRSWYADHGGGIISLPTVPGDGSESLRQLIGWLERNGYAGTGSASALVYTRAGS